MESRKLIELKKINNRNINVYTIYKVTPKGKLFMKEIIDIDNEKTNNLLHKKQVKQLSKLFLFLDDWD